jgi:hypothetical protein
MKAAIESHCDTKYFRRERNKIYFNGFWRHGDKQNVCAWLDSATWHDAKTGDGGGCKEFAKTAFNMSLPDFMKRFSYQPPVIGSTKLDVGNILAGKQKDTLSKPINHIWSQMAGLTSNTSSGAIKWLENERGFTDIARFVGSGFTCLSEKHFSSFENIHQNFLKQRLAIGAQLLVPLRSVCSDEVTNIVFRTIAPCDKNEKTRLLPNAGGWSEPDGSPRAFGFPHLILDFPHLVLCEGMADYFAAECLLEDNEKFLPLGVANADAFNKWAQWLINQNYLGHITLVYHLDKYEKGELTKKTVGPLKALQALALLHKNGLKAHLFDWPTYIENITTHTSEISDLADCLKAEATHRECGPGHLSYLFLSLLTFEEQA